MTMAVFTEMKDLESELGKLRDRRNDVSLVFWIPKVVPLMDCNSAL